MKRQQAQSASLYLKGGNYITPNLSDYIIILHNYLKKKKNNIKKR